MRILEEVFLQETRSCTNLVLGRGFYDTEASRMNVGDAE